MNNDQLYLYQLVVCDFVESEEGVIRDMHVLPCLNYNVSRLFIYYVQEVVTQFL